MTTLPEALATIKEFINFHRHGDPSNALRSDDAAAVVEASVKEAREALEFYGDPTNFLYMHDYGILEIGERNVDLQGTYPIGYKAVTVLKRMGA